MVERRGVDDPVANVLLVLEQAGQLDVAHLEGEVGGRLALRVLGVGVDVADRGGREDELDDLLIAG